jgi:hypothetical protein
LSRFDDLIVQGMGLHYPIGLLRALSAEHLAGPGPTLAVGVDGLADAHHLAVTHMLAHHHALRAWLAGQFPDRDVRCLIGLDTPFPDAFFGAAVVTDFLRLLPASIGRRVVRELARVARKPLLLCASSVPHVPQDFHFWASMDELRATIAAEGFGLAERHAQGPFVAYELVRAAGGEARGEGGAVAGLLRSQRATRAPAGASGAQAINAPVARPAGQRRGGRSRGRAPLRPGPREASPRRFERACQRAR